MAEALGLAASVISIASLAIQLADSVQKAREFWESVEEGPQELVHLSTELRMLSRILRFIAREHEQGAINIRREESLLKDALDIAKKDINELYLVVIQLSSKLGPSNGRVKRKWGQIRIALKAGKIAKLQNHIEKAKSTINLIQATISMIQGSRNQLAICQMIGNMELRSASVSTSVERVPGDVSRERGDTGLEQAGGRSLVVNTPARGSAGYDKKSDLIPTRTKTTWKYINVGLAALAIQSTSTTVIDPEKEQDGGKKSDSTRTSFVFNFLWGFTSCRRGFRLSTSSTFDSIKFDSIRRRPNDSLIFTLCTEGDTQGVHRLLLTGEASMVDTDEEGRGLLHYALGNAHTKLTKFLLSKGADYYLRSDSWDAPVDEFVTYDEFCDTGTVRRNIAEIFENIFTYTSIDPFDHQDHRYPGYHILVLNNGLPYENLRLLLSQDSYYVSSEIMFVFIDENIKFLKIDDEDFEKSIELLFTKYEAMWNDSLTRDDWPSRMNTSLPASRDAPCSETNRRYFEFKGLQIYEDIKIFTFFCFHYITYLS